MGGCLSRFFGSNNPNTVVIDKSIKTFTKETHHRKNKVHHQHYHFSRSESDADDSKTLKEKTTNSKVQVELLESIVLISEKFSGTKSNVLADLEDSTAKLVENPDADFTTAIKTYKERFVDFGPYKYPDQSIYTGEYQDQKRHGRGMLITLDRRVFDGFWDNDGFIYGRLARPSGEIYVGGMQGGKKEGQGELTWSGKKAYSRGMWRADQLHGPNCSKLYDDGSLYTGECKKGKRDGKGEFINGKQTYSGGWRNDELLIGKQSSQDETWYYEGSFKNMKAEGYGEMRDNKSDCFYCGNWKEDMKDGMGKEKFEDGAKYEGYYRNNDMNGEGTLENKQGKYVGQMKNGIREGKGIMHFIDGRVYEGCFIADKMEGRGKMSYPNGDQFEGLFVDNKESSEGRRTKRIDKNNSSVVLGNSASVSSYPVERRIIIKESDRLKTGTKDVSEQGLKRSGHAGMRADTTISK